MTWIYSLPAALFFLLTLAVMAVVASGGLLVFQRFAPPSDELTHNDVAGPIIGTVGTVLAVVLSFMLVVNWQQYDAAGTTVEQEASAVADLYHAAANLPQPVRAKLQSDLKTYVDAVVVEEWPLMRVGGRSETARHAALDVGRVISNYEPKTQSQQALQQSALNLAQTMEDQRRLRLFSNDQGIPGFMWIGNLILAAVTIGLCYLFRVRSRLAHHIMAVSLAIVIGVIFALTALVDYPFRGTTAIQPTLFVHLQQELGHQLTGSD
jgi:hypothetical protein